MLYRPDLVASWLSDGRIAPWEFNSMWLERRELTPPTRTEAATHEVI